ncbi:hypothetical protein E2542_SST31276 [Spatholobus suberectus]|nr:hypothetical protein E2542_SST31276 [Spatholobus suberectus]
MGMNNNNMVVLKNLVDANVQILGRIHATQLANPVIVLNNMTSPFVFALTPPNSATTLATTPVTITSFKYASNGESPLGFVFYVREDRIKLGIKARSRP